MVDFLETNKKSENVHLCPSTDLKLPPIQNWKSCPIPSAVSEFYSHHDLKPRAAHTETSCKKDGRNCHQSTISTKRILNSPNKTLFLSDDRETGHQQPENRFSPVVPHACLFSNGTLTHQTDEKSFIPKKGLPARSHTGHQEGHLLHRQIQPAPYRDTGSTAVNRTSITQGLLNPVKICQPSQNSSTLPGTRKLLSRRPAVTCAPIAITSSTPATDCYQETKVIPLQTPESNKIKARNEQRQRRVGMIECNKVEKARARRYAVCSETDTSRKGRAYTRVMRKRF